MAAWWNIPKTVCPEAKMYKLKTLGGTAMVFAAYLVGLYFQKQSDFSKQAFRNKSVLYGGRKNDDWER